MYFFKLITVHLLVNELYIQITNKVQIVRMNIEHVALT